MVIGGEADLEDAASINSVSPSDEGESGLSPDSFSILRFLLGFFLSALLSETPESAVS